MKKLIGVMLLFLLIGCDSHMEATKSSHLPSNAKNIVELGRDWYTFDLEVNGKTHKFLYRRHGILDQATECITKLD